MPNWPHQSECRAFYGAPGTGHTTIALPYPVRLAWEPKTTLSRFTIHRKCAASALKVLNQVKDAYGVEKIRELGLLVRQEPGRECCPCSSRRCRPKLRRRDHAP
jgi:hypothetical protein